MANDVVASHNTQHDEMSASIKLCSRTAYANDGVKWVRNMSQPHSMCSILHRIFLSHRQTPSIWRSHILSLLSPAEKIILKTHPMYPDMATTDNMQTETADFAPQCRHLANSTKHTRRILFRPFFFFFFQPPGRCPLGGRAISHQIRCICKNM